MACPPPDGGGRPEAVSVCERLAGGSLGWPRAGAARVRRVLGSGSPGPIFALDHGEPDLEEPCMLPRGAGSGWEGISIVLCG